MKGRRTLGLIEGATTTIPWCDHTFSPWWGCEEVSPACKFCYARTLARRWHPDQKLWGPGSERMIASEKKWNEPLLWNDKARQAGTTRFVFCASMADIFEDRPELAEPRKRLFLLMRQTPHLIWLALTKRPENVIRLAREAFTPPVGSGGVMRPWWPDNAWIGATVENQEQAEQRIPHLLRVPAPMRFLSCEPLLEPINLDPPVCPSGCGAGLAFVEIAEDGTSCCKECGDEMAFGNWLGPDRIGWVIVGGEFETTKRARPFALEWWQKIDHDCYNNGADVFLKQLGRNPTLNGQPVRELLKETWPIRDPKGETPDEWRGMIGFDPRFSTPKELRKRPEP